MDINKTAEFMKNMIDVLVDEINLHKKFDKTDEMKDPEKVMNKDTLQLNYDGTVIKINKSIEDMTGYNKNEILGKKISAFGFFNKHKSANAISFIKNSGINAKNYVTFDFNVLRKDGIQMIIEGNMWLIKKRSGVFGLSPVLNDVTKKRELENQKQDIEKNIYYNIKELVFPYIDKLKSAELTKKQKKYIEIIESNLNNITSPFTTRLLSELVSLSPSEMQIATLVRLGKTSKEISKLLNLSPKTIDTHRYSIRNKLGLKNKKVNLRSHLLSLK